MVPGSPGTDAYGDPLPAAGDPRPVSGCLVAWTTRGSSEPAERGRSGVTTDVVVHFPAGTAVAHGDRIRVRGELYDVEGVPGDWQVGVVVSGRRAEG